MEPALGAHRAPHRRARASRPGPPSTRSSTCSGPGCSCPADARARARPAAASSDSLGVKGHARRREHSADWSGAADAHAPMDRGGHRRRPGGGRRGDLVVPARPHRPHHDRHQHRRAAAATTAARRSRRRRHHAPPTLERRRPDDDRPPRARRPPRAAPPVQPAPGVYRYTTTGGDAVDALGGASHQYPATSTITVTVDGCATTQRWTAAAERWDELTTCAGDGGVQLQRFVSLHHFFGADDTETSTCDGQPRPLGAAAGTTWTARCVDGDETATWTGTVVGAETAVVGGEHGRRRARRRHHRRR